VTGSDGVEDEDRISSLPRKRAGHDGFGERPPQWPVTGTQVPPPADGKEANTVAALVKQAREFEREGRWPEARAVYQKLEKVKGYNLGEALYRQAYAAIQANAIDDAARLAALAVRYPGPFKTPSMFLYGDVWYRKGEYVRAKEIYITLRRTVAENERAIATKKVAACNKELRLPDNDGVYD
jgi:TolA-binding protein